MGKTIGKFKNKEFMFKIPSKCPVCGSSQLVGEVSKFYCKKCGYVYKSVRSIL